ncbi:MAG: outer membrane beta-barrel protein [Gemmatimonadaceae bacterium]|nr:outer membrane beta-barrel protein [Gemmatimonadaceae bacterium]
MNRKAPTVTPPVGLLTEASAIGWNAGVLVSFDLPEAPIGFRIDGQLNHLGENGTSIGCTLAPGGGFCPEPIAMRIVDGTANVVYAFRRAEPTSFYLIAGAGVYGERATSSAAGTEGSTTKFGLNAGAGVKLRFGTFGAFVEARYHNVIHGSDVGDYARRSPTVKSLQFVPISAGIIF